MDVEDAGSGARERLAALQSYGVLDTPREAAFDDITNLVARLCHAPIAVVNLIDESRQWFKAEVGIGTREMPLDGSICAKVFLGLEPVVVNDLTQDARFACLPLVQGTAGLRFYAGAPLVSSDGHALGTLCVLDTHVRELEPLQRDALVTLAAQVMAQLELRRSLAATQRAEQALRDADRRKDDFLATLAHELRNPLAPIRNATHLIALKDSADAQLRWSREVIERQVNHLTRLVDDLLDVSRISRDKIDLKRERIDLGDALHAALETSRPMIERQGHQLRVSLPEDPMWVDGDAVRLAQVFMNLLTNAAKYTDRGGLIELHATPRGDQVVVQVRDNGIGVAADQLPHMFEMFYQVESALDRTHGGLGIGLALVKRLVEMHGGEVHAASAGRGHGSTFEAVLPRAFAAAAPRSASAAHLPTGPSRRVLVADDNVDAAQSLAMVLQALGHVVRTVHDGQAAVEEAEQFKPDVALLDLGMPKADGFEAARQIRQLANGNGILLVALTGWGQADDRRRSNEAGFDRHLVKPAQIEALVALLA